MKNATLWLIKSDDHQDLYVPIWLAPPRRDRILFSVYAIRSLKNNRIYIGSTSDVISRLKYHNSGYVKSTSQSKPWELIALEMIETRDEARWIEYSLKKSRGKRNMWLEKYKL